MKLIVSLLLLLSPIYLWADAWDNLTLEEANKVVDVIETNPYLLDYCDCCQAEGTYATKVFLVKVLATKIVRCDWDENLFSVKAEVVTLAELPYQKDGPDIEEPIIMIEKKDLIIYTNYTWVYNSTYKKAGPIYTVIPYDYYGEQPQDKGSCRPFIDFPNPKKIKNKEYKNWYKRNLKG